MTPCHVYLRADANIRSYPYHLIRSARASFTASVSEDFSPTMPTKMCLNAFANFWRPQDVSIAGHGCKYSCNNSEQLETPNQKGKNAKETQQLAEKARKTVAEYMDRLEKITRRKGLSSRVKFMIQDLFDLRKRK